MEMVLPIMKKDKYSTKEIFKMGKSIKMDMVKNIGITKF